MKICIFAQQVEFMGGIERVALEQIKIFSVHGATVKMLLNSGHGAMLDALGCPVAIIPAKGHGRAAFLRDYFTLEKPDAIILHGESHRDFPDDMAIINECNIKSVCVAHFPFMTNIALLGTRNTWKAFIERTSACTAIATVSEIDAKFWRALGGKAFHVQNPFVHPPADALSVRKRGEGGTVNMIWVGRLVEQKQPEAALEAFALVAKARPAARLTMVGGDPQGIKRMARAAKRLGIADKTEFVPERPDISGYWAKADIHLLTSICESFCLVWAEAKAAGMPTVMFELPYLELAADPRGYVAVAQKDVKALADAAIALIDDAGRRERMGREARESLAPFNDDAVWESWTRLFAGLDDPSDGTGADADFKTVVTQIYAAVCHDKETHRWPEEMEADWMRLTHCSMRPFARFLHSAVSAVRKIKSKIRG